MDQRESLTAVFHEMAVLLELAGENPFKARAYVSAARFLESGKLSLSEILENPPHGFGKSLIDKVREFSRTNRLEEFDKLKEKLPTGLFELLKIPGLGPKKVKILYDQLKISNIHELETACKSEKLASLKGFGAKTQRNIMEGIDFIKKFKGSYLFSDAENIAADIVRFLKDKLGDIPISIAGSLRRKKEIVKDVDLLAASDGSALVMKTFMQYPGLEKILAEGETKTSIVLGNGMQIDLRVVSPESFGPALCHFTGSKEHNTRLRSLALEKGMKLNEYGLFTGKTSFPMATEDEVFNALGLAYIPPELREDLGEIDWAIQSKIPILVEKDDLIGILHVHTTYSDGRGKLPEMASAAQSLGFKWLGISDHSKSAHYANGLEIEKLKIQWSEIDELNSRNRQFRILKGIESDILPDGSLDYPDEILSKFDFVIASVHTNFGMSIEEMTARMIKAVENPYCGILGHSSGRLLLMREGYESDFDRVLAACVKCRVAVEINGNPLRLDLDWRKVRAFRDSGLKFIITPDAHEPATLAHVRYGLGIARKGALEKHHLLNCLTVDEIVEFFHSGRRQST